MKESRMLSLGVDIGSNSVLATLAKLDGDSIKVIEELSYVTGLGRGIQTSGQFSSEAMNETTFALEGIGALADKYKIARKNTLITGTEASRKAKNAPDYFKTIKENLGFEIKIISPVAEAYFAVLGLSLAPQVKQYPLIVIDIGGASSEVTVVSKSPITIVDTVSLPMGSVTATENPSIVTELLKLPAFQAIVAKYNSLPVWAISGTALTVASKILNVRTPTELEGLPLELKDTKALLDQIKHLSGNELSTMFGKRASTIAGGLSILIKLMDKLRIKSLNLSNFGLRHGLIQEGEIRDVHLWKHTR